MTLTLTLHSVPAGLHMLWSAAGTRPDRAGWVPHGQSRLSCHSGSRYSNRDQVGAPMSLASLSLTYWRPPGTAGGRETKARSTCWSTLPPSSPCSPASFRCSHFAASSSRQIHQSGGLKLHNFLASVFQVPCTLRTGPIQEGSQPGPRLDRKARVGKDPKAHSRYRPNQACTRN